MDLMTVNRQWASRPQDERFVSLHDLDAAMQESHRLSKEKVLSSQDLTVTPVQGDSKALAILGPNGNPVTPTNWAFNQLSGLVGAPASYLRTLPAPIVADNLNYGLKFTREAQDIGVLLSRTDGNHSLRAVTGPRYGRIWNSSISEVLVNRFGDGVSGDFRVPGEWGKHVDVTKDNTTLYASDRDLFVFLADEEHRIEMKDRRDGKSGALARGFIVGNSEVGAGTLWVALFLFDYVCGNRIIWGVQEYKEIRIRHTASALHHFRDKFLPALHTYATSSTAGVNEAIQAAQDAKIQNLEKFLAARFTRKQSEGIQAAHLADEGRPIETLWDATTAVTAYARDLEYQDNRVALEREGGKILALASHLDALDVDFEVIE